MHTRRIVQAPNPRRFRLLAMGALAALLLASCSSYGPGTIERDQMDYGRSLNTSIKQQLLANIVRLRYMEAPLFVDVASVINQYSLSGSVEAGAGFNSSITGGDAGSLGAGGRWEDRPTITYAPISGKKFAESLLTPIPPEALFALVQAGWPAELLFRLSVSSINGVADADSGPLFRKQADPRYRELLSIWTRLRQQGALGLRRSTGEAGNAIIVLYLRKAGMSEQTRQDFDTVRTTLQLNPEQNEYALRYGLVPDTPNELAVLTSSILDLMLDLAWQVDVPQTHIDEGRTASTFVDTGLGGSLFTVNHSEDEPDADDVFVAVQDRGYWFYIDDRDMVTKRTFGVLQILFSLTDAGEGARGPVLSIGG
ncbi:MAG: hypothetical protein ACR2QV_05855 [Gammaproteobacteria bacterium]